jgi:membrane-bound serine protease (ClpP class)
MRSPKSCRDLEVLLSAYVDHEATADEMAIVESHALACRACAARIKHYHTLVPRLEADVRTLLFESEVAAGRARPARFRDLSERVSLAAPPVGVLSRAATFAFVLAIAFVAAIVLARTAPAVQPPDMGTAAQPGLPATGPVQNPPRPGAPVLAVAAYVQRAVSAADEADAGALVVVLDASGGLDDAMHQAAQALADSRVPTLAFIAPGRGNAADATLARSTDLVAAATTPDVDAFLRAADGQVIQTPAGEIALALAGAQTVALDMDPLEAVAHRLMDPTTAYLLFILGLYAVFVEVAHPGGFVLGAAGVLCLSLASIAFVMLPTNWLGVALLVAAVGLMALELKAATHGGLVLAGVVCLIVGSIVLFSAAGSVSPVQTEITIAPGVLIGVAGIGLVGGLLLARIARQIHTLPPVLGLERLIGARGTSRSGLDPDGVVHVGGQLWSARLRAGRLDADRPVRVVARHGLVLEVESATLGAATQKGTLS